MRYTATWQVKDQIFFSLSRNIGLYSYLGKVKRRTVTGKN